MALLQPCDQHKVPRLPDRRAGRRVSGRIRCEIVELLRVGQPLPVLRMHEVKQLLGGSVRMLVRRVGRCSPKPMVLLAVRWSLALTLSALATAGASCDTSSEGRTGAGSETRPPAPRACAGQVNRPRDPGTFVLDRVYFGRYAIRGWRQGDKLQASRWSKREWFSKVGLAVRGVAPIVLRVPRERGRLVRMNWAGQVAPVISIRQPTSGSCPDQRWRTYYGGFVYAQFQCLVLQVEVNARRSTVPFGLGKAC